jgi:hypothetical protein
MRAALLLALLLTQAPSKEPVLSEVNRLQLQNHLQRLEISQLKAQAALRDFEVAKTDLSRLMEKLKVDGYNLDVTTMTYTPVPKVVK